MVVQLLIMVGAAIAVGPGKSKMANAITCNPVFKTFIADSPIGRHSVVMVIAG